MIRPRSKIPSRPKSGAGSDPEPRGSRCRQEPPALIPARAQPGLPPTTNAVREASDPLATYPVSSALLRVHTCARLPRGAKQPSPGPAGSSPGAGPNKQCLQAPGGKERKRRRGGGESPLCPCTPAPGGSQRTPAPAALFTAPGRVQRAPARTARTHSLTHSPPPRSALQCHAMQSRAMSECSVMQFSNKGRLPTGRGFNSLPPPPPLYLCTWPRLSGRFQPGGGQG